MSYDEMLVFAGSGSRKLTARICDYLRIPQGKNETLHFSDGNTFVRILENVRGRRVYLVQSTVFPANDNFMELLFWIDALKRASAESVTVVMPYFSYAKGDKKDEPGSPSEPVSAPMRSKWPEPIVWSRWTCTPPRFRA